MTLKLKNSIFVGRDWKTSLIRKKNIFLGLLRISDTAAGVSLRQAAMELWFGPEKLINSNLFAAGGNNKFEMIDNTNWLIIEQQKYNFLFDFETLYNP